MFGNWDLTSTLQALNAFASSLLPLLTAVAGLMGLALLGRAIFTMFKTDREEGTVNWASIAGQTVVAAMLLRLAGTTAWARELVGDTGSGMRDYLSLGPSGGGGGTTLQAIVSVGLLWVAVIGVIGIIRGLNLWADAAKGVQQGGKSPFWGGLWHILGGAIAINIGM